MRKFLIVTVMVLVLGAACSSDDNSSGTTTTTSNGQGASTTQPTASVPTPVQLQGKTNNEGTQDATAKPEIDVIADDFFFSPTFIQVTPGQSLNVHLSNQGSTAHTFTSTDLNVNETLQPGATADVTVKMA